MANFTMELRHVNELYDVKKIALSKYPIFDEGYRDSLNQKILDHYWLREIGHETPQHFFHYLSVKMNEVMPVYNKLYQSERMEFDPLSTIDMRTLSRGESDGQATVDASSSANSTGDSKSRAIGSTYPQTALSGSEDYADSGNDMVGTTTGTEKATSDTSSKSHDRNIGESHMTGRQQSGMSLVQEFRAAIINVDLMIISELEPLFMQLFGNGDFEPGEPRGSFLPFNYGFYY